VRKWRSQKARKEKNVFPNALLKLNSRIAENAFLKRVISDGSFGDKLCWNKDKRKQTLTIKTSTTDAKTKMMILLYLIGQKMRFSQGRKAIH
jgi:hypothetical protein